MRTKLIILASIALIFNMQQIKAQEIDREVTVEKEYTPEVDAAVKKTGVPEAENPLVEKPVNEYSTWAVPLSGTPTSQPILVSELKSQDDFNEQRGYANFGMGNNLNINGDAGIRILNSARNQLGVWYNHTSTGGHLKYRDNVPVYGGEKVYPVFLEPLATKIYDKQRLGDDLITDFVIQTLEDKYVLVEIEKPQDLIFTKQNDFSAKFTHAYGQVLDFLAWIDSNIAYAQTKLPNICLPSGLLVIGQSSALNPDQKKKLEYFNTLNTRIKVITYDEVLLNAQRLYKNIISSYN